MKGSTGNSKRTRPPAHQNETAFKHNPSSKLTAKILSYPISNLLCPTCKAVIEWRKQYRKYKPLTVAKKCTGCQQKAIKAAYHTRCDDCAKKDHVCCKCGESKALDATKLLYKQINNNSDMNELSSSEDCETAEDNE